MQMENDTRDGCQLMSTFNFSSGKWTVHFYDDNETTEVNFPDKEVSSGQCYNYSSCNTYNNFFSYI